MSALGILSTALAGGAGAIKDQAIGDIDQKRRLDIAAQTAQIEEQMRMRLSEFGERQRRAGVLYDATGEGGAAKLDLARRSGEQANDLAIKGKVAEATNTDLAAAKDAQAEAELQRDIKRINATSKPEAEKAAAIAEARARAEAKYRKADPTVQSKIAELKKQLGRDLTEAETLQAYGLAKSRDPELDTQTVTEERMNPDGTTSKTTRKEVRRPGQGGNAEQDDPYAVPKRDAKPAPGARPAAAAKPEGPGMLQKLTAAIGGAMDSGAEVGNAIEAVRRKVRAGQALSAEEAAIAKKYSIQQG